MPSQPSNGGGLSPKSLESTTMRAVQQQRETARNSPCALGLIDPHTQPPTVPDPELKSDEKTATSLSPTRSNSVIASKKPLWSFNKNSLSLDRIILTAICFAFTVIALQSDQWPSRKSFRYDCRAVLTLNKTVSKECEKALLGSLAPPPFMKRGNSSCMQSYDQILPAFVQEHLEQGPPTFWKYLLLPGGQSPPRVVLLTSIVCMPILLMLVLAPAMVTKTKTGIRFSPQFMLQFTALVFAYHVIGFTGLWNILGVYMLEFQYWSEKDSKDSLDAQHQSASFPFMQLAVFLLVPAVDAWRVMTTAKTSFSTIPSTRSGIWVFTTLFGVVIIYLGTDAFLNGLQKLAQTSKTALFVATSLRFIKIPLSLSSSKKASWLVCMALFLFLSTFMIALNVLAKLYVSPEQSWHQYLCEKTAEKFAKFVTEYQDAFQHDLDAGNVLEEGDYQQRDIVQGLGKVVCQLRDYKEQWRLYKDAL